MVTFLENVKNSFEEIQLASNLLNEIGERPEERFATEVTETKAPCVLIINEEET
jgi:hypothetical protein